ncbi:MAG: nucleoside 2-deoxyribosyltransferase [Armatimonadota bacterium]|nr:MAG: nucleoside 2-deoxyribosyltransferase [Armatimonadota bacterium]
MMPQPDFERFRTAVLCREPDRVPLAELKVEDAVKAAFLGRKFADPSSDPIAYLRDDIEFSAAAGYDYVRVTAILPYPEVKTAHTYRYGGYEGDTRRDWVSLGGGIIRTWEDFENFAWPSADGADMRALEAAAEHLPDGMKVVTAVKGGGIFERAWMLMGMEQFAMCLADDPDLARAVVDRAGALYVETCARAVEHDGVECVWFSDDLAHCGGMLVSPQVLRDWVFPWYQKLADLSRAHDLIFIFHSDGKLWEVMEDLLDIGFHALHPIEPKAMDIVEVKRRYEGRLCVIGNIDLGYTLTRGTPAEVEAEVRERIRALAPGGGYCVSSSNSITEYVPLDNYRAMLDATLRYGEYPINV